MEVQQKNIHPLKVPGCVLENAEHYLYANLRDKGTYKGFRILFDLSVQTVLRRSTHHKTQIIGCHIHYFSHGTTLAILEDMG